MPGKCSNRCRVSPSETTSLLFRDNSTSCLIHKNGSNRSCKMPIRRLPIPPNPPLRFGRNLTLLLFTVLLPFVSIRATSAQLGSISQRIASQAIDRWPGGRIESSKAARWNYSLGVLLEGMDATWYNTANKRYFQYIQNSVDALITQTARFRRTESPHTRSTTFF